MKARNVIVSLAALAVFGALAYYVYTKAQTNAAQVQNVDTQNAAAAINVDELQQAASQAYTENLINELTTDPNGSTAVAAQPAHTTSMTTIGAA